MTTKTLRGPQGLSITLDSSEIFPDDPGNGTPAMVHCNGHDATYWCAVDTGELDCGAFQLNSTQQNWLEAQEAEVSAFVEEYTK